jgi:hypothetical protein
MEAATLCIPKLNNNIKHISYGTQELAGICFKTKLVMWL